MRDQATGAVPAGSGWVLLMRMKILDTISFLKISIWAHWGQEGLGAGGGGGGGCRWAVGLTLG